MMLQRLLIAVLGLLCFTLPVSAARQFSDIACENTSTTGTGTINLAGAVSGGYLGFLAAGITSANTVPYTIVTGTGGSRKIETGWGVLTDGTPDTLTRVADWSTDGVGAELTLAGTSTVCITPISSVFTGGAGYTINADLLDGKTTGTTGNTVPLLDGTNTWSAVNTFTTVELGGVATATVSTPGASRAQIEGLEIKLVGTQTVYFPAGGLKANATSPASCGDTYDSGTNDVTISVCAFDTGATEERADFDWAPPKSYNGGTLTYQYLWTNTGGSAAQTVQLEVACAFFRDDDALNTVMGTSVTQSDTWTAANDLTVSAVSSAMTCGGTYATGALIHFRASRDTSVDNMTGDMLLIGIRIFWTDNAKNDT